MAAWAARAPRAPPTSRADWMRLIWLGCIGYYLASLLDFMGLRYITASLERLVLFLYPTIVVLLSALLLGQPVTRRAVVALVSVVCRHCPGVLARSSIGRQCARNAGRRRTGLCRRDPLRPLSRTGGRRDRAVRLHAFHRLGNARVDRFHRRAVPVDAAAGSARGAAVDPRDITGDGHILNGIADLAGRGIHTSHGRQCRIAGRLARSGLHHRTWRDDPGRAGPRDSAGRRGARAGRRDAGHPQDTRWRRRDGASEV